MTRVSWFIIGVFLPSLLYGTTGFSLLAPILIGIFLLGTVVAFFKVFMFFWDIFSGAFSFFRFFGLSRKMTLLIVVLLLGWIYYVYGESISKFIDIYVMYYISTYLPI